MNSSSATTISLINNKGGVGKTTTAIHLAVQASREGRKVLLVDLDAQASASLALGFDRDNLSPSIASQLYDDVSLAESIRTPPGADIDMITGSESLKNADVRLGGEIGRERLLQQTLSSVEEDYDLIFLDCPPSLSLLPVNAVVASDHCIVPVEPEYLALEGLGSLINFIRKVEEGTGTSTNILGIAITQADFRANATQQVVDLLRDHTVHTFDTIVHGNVRVSEASSFGKPVFDHAPSATGSESYRALTKEVLDQLSQ